MIEIIPDGPVDEDRLSAFERKLGTALPQEYRKWLRETGGGEAARDYKVENGVLSEFLGLGTTAVAYDLDSWRSNRTGFAAWVPEDFLIIAPASGGSVCLKLSEPERGSIWWADYDAAQELPVDETDRGQPLPEILRRVGLTLQEFLTQAG